MTARRQLVIDRAKWLRGQESTLLRKDGCGCAVGLYLLASGMPEADIVGQESPSTLSEHATVPAEASWVLSRWGGTGADAFCVISANDCKYLDEPEREQRIADTFFKHGVDVTFVGHAAEEAS